MKRVLGLSLLALPVFAVSLFAQRTAIFPRFASGTGWTSEFFFTNQGIQTVSGITVSFYDQNGNDLSVASNLGTNSSFTFNLAGGATQAIRITPGSVFQEGYVLVGYPSFNDPIRGSQIFRAESNGVVTTEVGAPQQEAGDSFSFPVEIDPTQHIYPAIALSNATDIDQDVVMDLIRADGSVRDTVVVPMAAGQHRAGYIDSSWAFPGINNTSFTGSVSISSPFGIGALTLRQDKDAFGGIATDGGPVIGPFALTGTSITEVEPNDTDLTANHITGSTIVTGTIGTAYDGDFFYFTGQKDQIITIICDTQGTGSSLDSVLAVYDSDLIQLAYNDQNGLAPGLYPENDSFIRMVLPADGIYYVGVWDYWNGGGPTYTYTLHINLQ
jgi:hypothetical protein